MTTAQVVETSVTVINNSPRSPRDDHTQPNYDLASIIMVPHDST